MSKQKETKATQTTPETKPEATQTTPEAKLEATQTTPETMDIEAMCNAATLAYECGTMSKTLWLWEVKGAQVIEQTYIEMPDGTRVDLAPGQTLRIIKDDGAPRYVITPCAADAEAGIRKAEKAKGAENVTIRKVDTVVLEFKVSDVVTTYGVKPITEERRRLIERAKEQSKAAKAAKAASEAERREDAKA